ncbi:uncharacterized protein [Montipora capricornis]|uniref:uncharacterized protein n=1 Tax=Montipora capricornis TaxID=246305 RepID=UPI0035F18BC4
MNSLDSANLILPAPGVSRNSASNTEARRSSDHQNEDVSVNHVSWGKTSENSRCLQALLRCKKFLFIATCNASTLRDEDRVLELEQCTQHQGIEILGEQEHHIIHDDPIEFRKVCSRYLVTSSGWRNEAQASQGGVGLLLGQKARKALLKAKRISKRIMTVEFNGNPQTTVIVVYAPTNCADEVEVEGFYNDMSNTLQDFPAHNFLACIGDFNARLGPDVVPFTYHDVTNRNGKYLVESKLLGNPPEVEDLDEEIPNIFEDLDINDGLFTVEELKEVKSSLRIGKAAGPDAIPREVFKLCGFDNICLDFCNQALIKK